MTLPLIICGAFGRMGQAITKIVDESDNFAIVGGVVKNATPKDVSFPIYQSLHDALTCAQGHPVVIDFSSAICADENIRLAQSYKCPLLLATTGHTVDVTPKLKAAAQIIPVIHAPNTSLMANLTMLLTRMAASILPAFDASIIDIHHQQKKDAPSGTAKALRKALQDGAKISSDFPIHSLRHGAVVGDHSVLFFNEFERLELTHRVSDRAVFAQGALIAAQFLFDREPGLYDMIDVLNLKLTIEK